MYEEQKNTTKGTGAVTTITGVKDFFSILEEQQLNFCECYSRGESMKYNNSGDLKSSAVRENDAKYLDSGCIDDFYNCVGNELTDLQNQHFMAYAQHHGLPTQLLDFTESPLVSLFFACNQYNEKCNEESGYVYFIQKKRCINISHEISGTKSVGHNTPIKSLLFNMIDYPARLTSMAPRFRDCFDIVRKKYDPDDIVTDDAQKFYGALESVISAFNLDDSFTEKLNEFYNDNEKSYMAWSSLLKENMIEPLLSKLKTDSHSKEVSTKIKGLLKKKDMFIRLLPIFIYLSIYYRTFSGGEQLMMDFPLYFTYNPPEICNRVAAQSSLFIYQLAWKSSNKSISYQRITPDFTLKIEGENKTKILKELDTLGINMKSIMGGHDAIAQYIKWKHSV